MSRAEEIAAVSEALRDHWLAGQLDELEKNVLERLVDLAREMSGLRKVLIALLCAVVTATIVIPVSIIWGAAIGGV